MPRAGMLLGSGQLCWDAAGLLVAAAVGSDRAALAFPTPCCCCASEGVKLASNQFGFIIFFSFILTSLSSVTYQGRVCGWLPCAVFVFQGDARCSAMCHTLHQIAFHS